jgi:hypothetical protein
VLDVGLEAAQAGAVRLVATIRTAGEDVELD